MISKPDLGLYASMKGSLGGALISLSMSWHLRLIECALNVSWGERKQEGEGKKGDKVEKPQVMMIHVLVLGLCLAISSSCWSGRAPGPSATTAEESTSPWSGDFLTTPTVLNMVAASVSTEIPL